MSLLLQALQKASKSRDEATADVSPDAMSMEDELALEPSAPASRGRQEASPPPTSAYAATVVQAGSVPTFDPLDYAREHYMLTFVGVAILLAIAYGTYVYVQVARPFRNFSPGPIPTAASPAPPPSLASTPPPSASAKISGMPGGTTATANTTVVATKRQGPMNQLLLFPNQLPRLLRLRPWKTRLQERARRLTRHQRNPPERSCRSPAETLNRQRWQMPVTPLRRLSSHRPIPGLPATFRYDTRVLL
jgi:hypothetical protein